MRPVPTCAKDIVREFEGLRLESYLCPAGVWTIGWGSTAGVHAGMRIGKPDAERRLDLDLNEARARLYGVLKPETVAALSEGQYAALIDFSFNLGTHNRKTGKPYGIWAVVNRRQFDSIPAELRRYVYAGKAKLKGLIRRREAEAALWDDDASDAVVPSSFTREEETAPAPLSSAKPLMQSKSFLSAAGTGVAAVSVAAGEMIKAVQPWASMAPELTRALAFLAMVAAGCACMAVFFAHLKNKQAAQ